MTSRLTAAKFWHLDAETKSRADPARLQTNRYDIVPASFKEVEKVKSIYANCPRPNYHVAGVEAIIVDEDRERGFTNHLRDFRVKKREALTSSDQAEIEQLFNHIANPYIDTEHPNVALLPTWHGTTPDAVFGICERNYEPTASDRVDGGYFGAGIYSTYEADYAHRIYTQGALLLNWTAAGSTYYVLEKDHLHGDTLKYGYDAHFVPVKASALDSWKYLASKAGEHTYTELVVREKAACLPRYKVDLQPTIVKPSHLVERRQLLQKIHEAFQTNQKVIISGLLKIGKSTLGNAYVNEFADSYFFIWWINCSNPKAIKESYNDLAGYLKTHQEILDGTILGISEIHKRLKNLTNPKPWLLVYDGLEEDILLPENVPILITTRETTLNGYTIEVPPLSEEEGLELLNRLLHKTKPSEEHKKQLIRECGYYPSLIYQIATHIEKTKELDIETFLQSPSGLDIEAIILKLTTFEEHRLFYLMLSRREHLEYLRTYYLTILERKGVAKKNWIDELSQIPTRTGLRQSTLRQELKLRQLLDEITQGGSNVNVQSSFWNKPRYLNPHVVEFDDQGNIFKKYADAAHLVAPGHNGLLHFKQKPTLPLMEYAVFNLTSRLAGHLMPATELVRFEVNGRSYPVLISETVKGASLRDAISNPNQKFDQKQWTWHLLSALLMRPGDGHLSNYILDESNRLFCIDNDFSFVEPVVDKGKFFSDIHIQFFSALFCLKVALDQNVLKAFCILDIDAIIAAWIEDVIEKEKQYLQLFPDPKETEALYNQEPNPGFKPSIMFQQGTLATIILQFWQLHDYISHALDNRLAVTLDGLLKQLIRLDNNQKVVPIGGHVSKAYNNVDAKNLYTALKKFKNPKAVESSMTHDQYQAACFGKPLSFQESEKKELSSQEAKEELFQTIVQVSSEFAEISTTLSKNFEKCTRSEWVLSAMIDRVKAAPAHVVINHCSILTSERLKPFLHSALRRLDVRFCSQIGNTAIRNLQANCHQLEELLISHSQKLTAISNLVNGILEFLNLKHLSISNCSNLTTFNLKGTKLVTLKLTHNDNLLNINFEAPSLQEVDFRYSDKVHLTPSAESSILEALFYNPRNLAFAPLTIRSTRDKILEDMRKNRISFEKLHKAFKVDKEILLIAVKKNSSILRYVEPLLLADEEFMLRAIKENVGAFQFVSTEFQTHEKFVLAAAQYGQELLFKAPELRNNENLALALVQFDGSTLQFVAPKFLHNEAIVLAAVKQNGLALKFAAPELKANEAIVLAAVSQNGLALEYAAPELWANEKIVLKAVELSGLALEFASPALKSNKAFVLLALSLDYRSFQYTALELRSNEKFMLSAISKNGLVIEYAGSELRSNEKFMLAAVKLYGSAIRYVPINLHSHELALGAVSQDGLTLKYVATESKANLEVALAAVTQNGFSLEFASPELRANEKVVLAAVTQNGFSLEFASIELRANERFLLAAVSQNASALQYASIELRANERFLLAAVSQNASVLRYASPELQASKKIVLAAVLQDASALQYASIELRANERFLLAAVSQNASVLRYASPELQASKKIVLAAVLQDGSVLEFASPKLQANEKIVLAAVLQNGSALEFASPELRANERFLLTAFSKNASALEFASPELRANERFLLTAFSKNASVLQYASPELLANEKFMLAAVLQQGYALKYASPELRANEKVVLAAVSKHGYALEFVSPEMRANEKVVLAAISQDGFALEFASLELRANEKFLLAAVSQHGYALKYASIELQANEKVVLAAVSQHGYALKYASPELRANERVVLAAVSQNGSALQYASPQLQANEKIVLLLYRKRE